MDTQTILYVVAALLMLVGIAGTVLPALPGIPLVFAGMVMAAWAGDFQYVGWGWLLALGILTVLSLGIDLLAGSMGAKRVGASKLALVGAVLGSFVGLFFGPLGLFAGPFVGALAGELVHRRDLGLATKVGVGTWFGILLGTVLKLGLAFGMLGLFAFAWWV
ncbi:membrane protein [Lysobacter daejeonensis GH1-9]|uniref:Membrane protein n=1 Tax=Lysobacter daejeonensis GH1-9 TaxID=1385517 RepID=A0A0A0F3C9_9GAMM|nr:DUF456 family protein [Lysobacter daejeonensis]KGM55872.1 membrane protein [Lysobacter daejeonensis GH1-9]